MSKYLLLAFVILFFLYGGINGKTYSVLKKGKMDLKNMDNVQGRVGDYLKKQFWLEDGAVDVPARVNLMFLLGDVEPKLKGFMNDFQSAYTPITVVEGLNAGKIQAQSDLPSFYLFKVDLDQSMEDILKEIDEIEAKCFKLFGEDRVLSQIFSSNSLNDHSSSRKILGSVIQNSNDASNSTDIPQQWEKYEYNMFLWVILAIVALIFSGFYVMTSIDYTQDCAKYMTTGDALDY